MSFSRARSSSPNFRDYDVFCAIRQIIAQVSGDDFRVIHFSVQETHIHLIIEADDQASLSRGVQHLARRITWEVKESCWKACGHSVFAMHPGRREGIRSDGGGWVARAIVSP